MRRPLALAMPRWGWIVLAVLTGLVLLPLYLRYFGWISGTCAQSRLLDTLMPRV